MQIIFGKYTIPFKTYSSVQLGFDDYFPDEVKIRVIQDCAHFFFIPCFGMGKDYFYKEEGKYHPLPHDLVVRLQAQKKIRTPIFAYALPLLILLTIGGFLLNGMVRNAHRSQSIKRIFSAYLEKTNYALEHLGPHHVIKLKNPADPYGSPSVYLQVMNVGEQAIECRVLQSFESRLEKSYALANAFQNPSHPLSFIQIPKKDLTNAVCRNASQYVKGYRPAVPLLKDGTPYYVESITYLDGPEINAQFYWNTNSPNVLEIYLENTGSRATLVSIKNKAGDINWTSPLPQLLPGGYEDNNKILIKGATPDNTSHCQFLLTLEDSLGSQHTFSVTSANEFINVMRIY